VPHVRFVDKFKDWFCVIVGGKRSVLGVDVTGVDSRYGVNVSGEGPGDMDGIGEAFSCVTDLDGIII